MTIIQKHLEVYGNIVDVPKNPDTALFKYKQKVTVQTRNDRTEDI